MPCAVRFLYETKAVLRPLDARVAMKHVAHIKMNLFSAKIYSHGGSAACKATNKKENAVLPPLEGTHHSNASGFIPWRVSCVGHTLIMRFCGCYDDYDSVDGAQKASLRCRKMLNELT